MSPPIHKEWWVAAATLAGTVPVALGQVPPAPPPTGRQQVGIVTTAAPQAPNGFQVAPLFVETAANQRVVNSTTSPMHILFSDQSAVTLAPNAEIMIAQYRYQPEERRGNIAINLLKGVLRVVGGQISKTNAAQVRTATATIGIRGGISIVEAQDNGQTRATFLFGQDLTFDLDRERRPTGGSGDSALSVEELRTAGWFTEGGDVGQGRKRDTGSGDSGQSGDALLASIRTTLTQPGWSAQGGANLLSQIEVAKLDPAALTQIVSTLAAAAAQVAAGGAPASQAIQAAISAVATTLPPVPPPPPNTPLSLIQAAVIGSSSGGTGGGFGAGGLPLITPPGPPAPSPPVMMTIQPPPAPPPCPYCES